MSGRGRAPRLLSPRRLALDSPNWYFGVMLEASQIENMSVAERLQAIEQLWDAVCHETRDLTSPIWHREVLADRKLRAERGESQFLTLAQLRARVHGAQQ